MKFSDIEPLSARLANWEYGADGWVCQGIHFFLLYIINALYLSIVILNPDLLTHCQSIITFTVVASMKLYLLQYIGVASAVAVTSMQPAQPTPASRGPVTTPAISPDQTSKAMEKRGMQQIREELSHHQDSWQCATETMQQYFEVPMASGELSSSLISWRRRQTSKYCDRPVQDWYLCDDIPTSAWCEYTTAAPSNVRSAYATHISEAYSWSSERSASLAVLPTNCPDTWDRASYDVIDGPAWLNETIAQAACYAQAHGKADDKDGHKDDGKDDGQVDSDDKPTQLPQESESQSRQSNKPSESAEPKQTNSNSHETNSSSHENKAGGLGLPTAAAASVAAIWAYMLF